MLSAVPLCIADRACGARRVVTMKEAVLIITVMVALPVAVLGSMFLQQRKRVRSTENKLSRGVPMRSLHLPR